MNELVERVNTYLSARPGLVPLIGVIFIIVNLLLQIIPAVSDYSNWFIDSNILLHIGLITSIIGLLVIRAWSD